MGDFASKDKKRLSEIAIIDEDTINMIVGRIPPVTGTYTHPTTHSATMIDETTARMFISFDERSQLHNRESDDQDLSGLQPKETGKGLSANDLTDTLKTNYDNAVTHAGSSHAPTTAQKNSDITKPEIEAKLTGEVNSHSHASSGGLTQQQILRLI